jgi:hypothetical protein
MLERKILLDSKNWSNYHEINIYYRRYSDNSH